LSAKIRFAAWFDTVAVAAAFEESLAAGTSKAAFEAQALAMLSAFKPTVSLDFATPTWVGLKVKAAL
jgi:hypothetical protein